MRKIIVFNLLSLDGFYAGIEGNIDWHHVDDEFNKFAVKQTKSFGAIIFGRVTYKIFEDFWPAAVSDPKMSAEDHEIAKTIDDIEKIVFSKSLDKVTWKNTKLFSEIDSKEVLKWKAEEGNDMVIFGSGKIVQQMTKLGLIDEYRFLINPIVLGEGKEMFEGVGKFELKLLSTHTFGNGNVLLTYEPIKS